MARGDWYTGTSERFTVASPLKCTLQIPTPKWERFEFPSVPPIGLARWFGWADNNPSPLSIAIYHSQLNPPECFRKQVTWHDLEIKTLHDKAPSSCSHQICAMPHFAFYPKTDILSDSFVPTWFINNPHLSSDLRLSVILMVGCQLKLPIILLFCNGCLIQCKCWAGLDCVVCRDKLLSYTRSSFIGQKPQSLLNEERTVIYHPFWKFTALSRVKMFVADHFIRKLFWIIVFSPLCPKKQQQPPVHFIRQNIGFDTICSTNHYIQPIPLDRHIS